MEAVSVCPPSLREGDKIGIVAPSRVIFKDQISTALDVFKHWGLEPVLSQFLFESHGYFAGSDDQRAGGFQEMLDDQEIKAIFCARGGYGVTRILDELDFSIFKNSPKWIVGFSDITALHLQLNKIDIQSVHGLMPVQFGYKGVEQSIDSLKAMLFGYRGQYSAEVSESSKGGKALAPIVGGNLSLICDSLGTNSEIDTNQKILFIEEIDEYLYKIDRMMTQLKRAGKLNDLRGVILGDFSLMKDTEIPLGLDIEELLLSYFKDLSIPVAVGFPAGHEPHHLALPISRMVEMKVLQNRCELVL